MLKTTAMLLDDLKEYSKPANKLARLVAQGKYYPVTKGLYEDNSLVPGYLLAGSIYGPSYISFDFALSYYGLIPEAVYTVTCATYNKRKKKTYSNIFGEFSFRDVPADVFYLGIRVVQEDEYFYRIATQEKALCDKLYTLKPVENVQALKKLLLDDLRIDVENLSNLDLEDLKELSEKYHSTNVRKLYSLVRRLQNGYSY